MSFVRRAYSSQAVLGLLLILLIRNPSAIAREPLVDDSVVFAERDGLVAVEAEHFFRQTMSDTRAFHLTHAKEAPAVTPDGDPQHVAGASGGAYLEVLPDTRRTHDDELIRGENFAPEPGKLAVLDYKVHFHTPGRYYVGVRAYSTGTVRCLLSHCQVCLPHIVQFSMREDGFEFDKWIMTTDREFSRPEDAGPAPALLKGTVPPPFPLADHATHAADSVER